MNLQTRGWLVTEKRRPGRIIEFGFWFRRALLFLFNMTLTAWGTFPPPNKWKKGLNFFTNSFIIY